MLMSWLIPLSSTSASQTKPLADGCEPTLPVLHHRRAAALIEASPIPDCQNALLSLPGWVVKSLGCETVAFSEIHAELKVGCSAPHKDEGQDALLNRGYFPTEWDKFSNKMGCILEDIMQG